MGTSQNGDKRRVTHIVERERDPDLQREKEIAGKILAELKADLAQEENAKANADARLESLQRDWVRVRANPEIVNDGKVYHFETVCCLTLIGVAASVLTWVAAALLVDQMLAIVPAIPSGLAAFFGFREILIPNRHPYFHSHHYRREVKSQQIQKARINERISELTSESIRAQQRVVKVNKARAELLRKAGQVSLANSAWRDFRGVQFELFACELLKLFGFQVNTTAVTGDQGVDLTARLGERYIAIQCKGYGGSVGNSAVQQAHAGMAFYHCNEAWCITNSVFTSSAVSLAQKTNCRLIDGHQITKLLSGDAQALGIVDMEVSLPTNEIVT